MKKKSPKSRLLTIATLSCALIFGLGGVASAQRITDGSTPLGLSPGGPTGSYSLSDFDSINLYNGSLNFSLPLVKIGGRGGAGYTMSLRIQKKWLVEKEYGLGQPNRYTPNSNWWGLDGQEPIYSVGKMEMRQAAIGATFSNRETLTRLTFTAPDGSEYELRDQLTNGQPYHPTTGPEFNRGKLFVTSDGSSAIFTADADIFDYRYDEPSNAPPSGDMVTRDGAHFRIDGGRVMWMRDRNGNKLTFAYTYQQLTSITDALNRQVTITYADQNTPYDQITVKGFGGAARSIKIYKGSALRSDFSALTYKQLFPELNGASDATFTPSGVTAVELPNGQQYQFYYNSYSELARVVLPTGGAIEYDYAPGLTDGTYSGVITGAGNKHVYRRVIERRVYPDGGSGAAYASRMTYSRPESTTSNSGYVATDHYNSSTALLSRSYHYFYGSPRASFGQQPTQYSGWKDGREYQTTVFATDGTTPLRQVTSVFAQRAAVSWWTGNSDQSPPNDPRLVETTTTLADTNQVSKQEFGYDDSVPFNNPNNVKEYDFGSGASGALLRETRTTYVTSSDYTGTAVGLLSLPLQTSIFDGSGAERARTTFEYDNYNSDASHAGLVYRSAISGFDAAFSTSYLTRGNATATTPYFLTNGSVTGSISTYVQYDMAGNVVKAIDGRGSATTLDFSDRFGAPDAEARGNSGAAELNAAGQYSYAFPTSATNALGHTAYTQFDYYLGRPVDAEDENGIVSSSYRNDALDRPTQVIRAANQGTGLRSQSTVVYDEVNHMVTTTRDLNTYGDNLLQGQIVYDAMGRTTEKRQYESASGYIAEQQTYDVLGRSYQTSNPFRSDDTIVWTTTGYDALNRIVSGTTPDSATVATSYSGNTVTVTDQAGRQRQSVTDALGRLIQVYEAPNDSNYNYLTSYSYDALNNLTTVTQGSQSRTFVYDSLTQLMSATNPESGTVSYTYDNNGNILSKTDARSVTTTLTYDSINRPTAKSYSDGTATASYYYDSQTLPSGAPSYTHGYTTGRLVACIYGSGSEGTYRGYDEMGGVVRQYQRTDSVNYLVEATYNLSGEMASETYPSVPGASDRRTVSLSYDNAARLSALSSSATSYAPGASIGSISYAASSALASQTYGNSLIHAVSYNSRLQPSEIKLGTSGNPTSVVDLAYNYGTTANNGNLQSVTYSGGGLSYTQSFSYDSLNRLSTAQENSGSSWSQTNGYDRYANRWIDWGSGNQSLYFSTSNNRINLSGYTYDSAGNLTNDTIHAYTFDAENKMSKVDNVSAYVYDGEGQRVRKLVGENTRFVYGLAGQLVAEFDGSSGNLKKEYVNGSSLITIEPTAVNSNGTQYSTGDHLGSPRVITNSSAGVVGRHDYMPFGEELGATVGGRTTGMGFSVADGSRQKFTQKERDIETGLDFFEARYYASMQGRFTSTDPIIITADRLIDPQEFNLYNYARNNPLRFTDPSGEDIDDSSLDKNKDYQSWKKAYLSTKAGQAEWNKYNDNHNVTITISMGANAGGKQGAETTPAFDANGKFTGATIVLGTDFAKGDSLNSSEYPISSSMTGTAEHSNSIISRTDRAVDFFAHEFGHVDDAQKQGALWVQQTGLLKQSKEGFEKQGQAWFNTSQYKQIVSQLGDTPANISTGRENRAEAAVIPVMRDYYGKGAGHGSMPSRVKQAIQNYEKAHP